jgi:hypothetical protein
MTSETDAKSSAPDDESADRGQKAAGDASEGGASSSGAKPGPGNEKGSQSEQPPKEEARHRTAKEFSQDANPLLGATEAYRSGQRSYWGRGASTFVRDSHVDNMHIGDTIYQRVVLSGGERLSSGPVGAEVVEWVRARYVPVDDCAEQLEVLAKHHLLLLHGLPDTGRATTGLYLLDRVAPGPVARWMPGAGPGAMSDDEIEPGGGYLAEAPDLAGESTAVALDRLRATLAEQGAYCVMVLDRRPPCVGDLDGYLRQHVPPHVAKVVARHVVKSLRHLANPGLPGRLDTPYRRVLDELGRRPRMRDAVAAAELLVSHRQEGLTTKQVVAGCRDLIRRQVNEWFAPLDGVGTGAVAGSAHWVAAFRIALAVYTDTSYLGIHDAAAALARKLTEQGQAGVPGGSELSAPGGDRESRLAGSRAMLYTVQARIGSEPVPVDAARFVHTLFPPTILTSLWGHDSLRSVVLTWLKERCALKDQRGWLPAARSLGFFATLDLPRMMKELITDWAASDKENERLIAALVLDQAAQDETKRRAVRGQLHEWVRAEDWRLRWTAAATLGWRSGYGSVLDSLEQLRIVGSAHDNEKPAEKFKLMLIVSAGVASLFAAGRVTEIIGRLWEWLGVREHDLRILALMCVVQIMWVRPFHSWNPDGMTVAAGREGWPVMLALADTDPGLAADLANLAWHALLPWKHQYAALNGLRGWIRDAQDDADCRRALAGFLPLLLDAEADYQRLLELLRRMRDDWVDPLDPQVADYLGTAVQRAWQDVVRVDNTTTVVRGGGFR